MSATKNGGDACFHSISLVKFNTGRKLPAHYQPQAILPDLHNTSMYSALRASLRLFTKIDWIYFEHHVLCDGPQGESQGCDE